MVRPFHVTSRHSLVYRFPLQISQVIQASGEVHFQFDGPSSAACLTTATFDVEAEVAGLVASLFREFGICKQFPNLVEDFGVCSWV